MTSISPAQPRPPPLSLHPGLQRAHSRSGSQLPVLLVKEEKGAGSGNESDLISDRPAKRRKTINGSLGIPATVPTQSLHTSIPNGFQSAPWSVVVRMNADNQEDQGTEIALPPLPHRPWGTIAQRETTLQDIRPPVRLRKNVAVPNTPDSIEVPPDAPRFEWKTLADYFPWSGKHREDVLDDTSVKQGYFDRPPNPPDKELNTAKPPLYNAFKHRSGLDSLSALFSLVLDSRSKRGTFSSISSFRGPPPRVTLTEVKRKSWISDLANPDVPLRKLSKTIPQGIRGPFLLEQCLHNNIPLSRAIWFTKCVGANEIRTLKRKGVNSTVAQAAEIKWLREWTVNIEQFIENLLAQCGPNQWKDKMRYSISFAARLYLENLLDRDHYLDWILRSLAGANVNHWPFWLMIVRLHRMDLFAYRKKGKQLAENLILKYNAALSAPADTLQPLAESFAAAIRPLITARPNCFLMPDKWTDCHKALLSCLDVSKDADRQTLERLTFVNIRALGGMKQGGLATASSSEQVVELLDSFGPSISVSTLYDTLCEACPDLDLLMQQCIEWCVSKYRTGRMRIYLSARLFRKMRKQGCDTDQILLDFIFNRAGTSPIDLAALRHLVSELSRSQSFPLSKYMQWLSVRGLPQNDSVSEYEMPIDISQSPYKIKVQESNSAKQLLTEICSLNTDDHLINLRNSLLTRAGFDDTSELIVFENLRSAILTALTNSNFNQAKHIWPKLQLGRLPWTTKTRLAQWLRAEVARFAKLSQNESPGKPQLSSVNGLTLDRFQIVRDILERAGDIAILADVLRIASASRIEDVLAASVDTINVHSATFAAIGALEPLQMLFGQTYVMLRSMKPAMPSYAISLTNLCSQYPIKAVPVRALQQDFVRGDRGRAVTACSPFSDGVAESLQQAGASFHDDFEAILQTESNMNDQTMIRLFRLLVERIEKTQYVKESIHDLFVSCQLLARLKLCQRAQGELLIKKWIARLCTQPGSPMSSQLLFCLICTRCVQLEAVMEAYQQLPSNAFTCRTQLFTHVRRAIMEDVEDGIDETLSYGFRLAVLKLTTTKPVELLDIIGTDESGRSSTSPIKPILISAVLSNQELIKTLSKPAWLIVSQTLSECLSEISSTDPPGAQARLLALSASALSLPYCALRMRMLCQNPATKNDESIQDDIATVLCSTAADSRSSLSTSPRTFQTLLRSTGATISAKVRSNIEQSFFNALPKFLQSKGLSQPPLPTPEETQHAALALQQVILVSTEVAGIQQPSGISGLIEKFTIYMKTLGPLPSGLQQATASSPVTPSTPAIFSGAELQNFLLASLDHLEFLLQMLCIKRPCVGTISSPPGSTAAKAAQSDQVKLVGLLITIGTHPVWSTVVSSIMDRSQRLKLQASISFTFDVAATLVDDMSDESRTFCARILKEKIRDRRVQWLLGSVNSLGSAQSQEAGHGYQVVHETKGVLGEWKPKAWEMLESGGTSDSCLGLGLFGARKA